VAAEDRIQGWPGADGRGIFGGEMRDLDTIPWQAGLAFFLCMIAVAGLIMGAAVQHPWRGVAAAIGAWLAVCICGITHDRIRHGKWFVK
jgi:hypothetical protein